MGFVCEKISEDDISTYGLRAINARLRVVGFGNGWVIDRERNVYLRWIRCDKETPSEMSFTLFWKGSLLDLRIVGVSTGDATEPGGTTWTLAHTPLDLPPELEPHREQILRDLREALTAYRSFGMSSTITQHSAKFNF